MKFAVRFDFFEILPVTASHTFRVLISSTINKTNQKRN